MSADVADVSDAAPMSRISPVPSLTNLLWKCD
jgi:hypothetical protein